MATQRVERAVDANGHKTTGARPSVKNLQRYLIDHPETGEFTVARALFSDPELFELERRERTGYASTKTSLTPVGWARRMTWRPLKRVSGAIKAPWRPGNKGTSVGSDG